MISIAITPSDDGVVLDTSRSVKQQSQRTRTMHKGGPPDTASSKSSRCVFVGNIPYDASEEKLIEIFQEVGPVVSFRLVVDKEKGKPKGYGFCEYRDAETAQSAIRNLQNVDLNGRQLRVDFAENEKGLQEGRAVSGVKEILSNKPQHPGITKPLTPQETVNNLLDGMSHNQLYDVIWKMKLLIQNNPDQARRLLAGNPSLSYALLQALVVLGTIEPPVAQMLLTPNQPPPSNLPPNMPPNQPNMPVDLPPHGLPVMQPMPPGLPPNQPGLLPAMVHPNMSAPLPMNQLNPMMRPNAPGQMQGMPQPGPGPNQNFPPQTGFSQMPPQMVPHPQVGMPNPMGPVQGIRPMGLPMMPGQQGLGPPGIPPMMENQPPAITPELIQQILSLTPQKLAQLPAAQRAQLQNIQMMLQKGGAPS